MLPLFNGFIAILFGVLALFVPGDVILSIVMYLGIISLFIAVAMAIGVVNNIKRDLPFTTDLFETLLVLGLGILLTFFSRNSLEFFAIIVGSWAIILGVLQLYIAFQLDPAFYNRKNTIINAVVILLFGLALFFDPFNSAKFFIVIIGIVSLFIGVFLIVFALKLKRVSKETDNFV
jgi:uncharacterized membrane protein HdeD (DUF308 family)